MILPDQVLTEFGLQTADAEIIPFGNGLINHTWRIKSGKNDFILQMINGNVFKQPEHIAANIRLLSNFFRSHHPSYLFTHPLLTTRQEEMAYIPGYGHFRLFPFIRDAHTSDTVTDPSLAYEAARQFGRFTRLLSGFTASELHITLPDFHNLPLRIQEFEWAAANGNVGRIRQSAPLISFLRHQHAIVEKSRDINTSKGFRVRVTHHDTKISNVLFDKNNRGLCVIDLDTVMPGYFISDVGDMMRTYLCPVSEEEKDFTRIKVRDDYFKAVADGYMEEMRSELSDTEKNHFVYAGLLMTYMQALRFLTDYLNNDKYYGKEYDEHNLVRAGNQVELLKRLIEKEDVFNKMIRSTLQG